MNEIAWYSQKLLCFHLGAYWRLNKSIYLLVGLLWLGLLSLYFSSKTNWHTHTKEYLLTFTETQISMCNHFLICEVEHNDGDYMILLRKLGELIYLKAHNKFFFMFIILTVKTAITDHYLINSPNWPKSSTSYIKI